MNKKSLHSLILAVLMVFSFCKKEENIEVKDDFYRQSMRDFVIALSAYSREINPSFIIIPQNGQELITSNGETSGLIQSNYIHAINGTGREDLFFGYNSDNKETPETDKTYMLELCRLFDQNNLTVLTIDYCSTQSKMDSSYIWNERNGFISFAANKRELNNIPEYPTGPYNENINNITDLSEVKNFLYLINSEQFNSKADFIDAVKNTNYDLIIIDLFHNEEEFTTAEVAQLKVKRNGGVRLVIGYMSIGEAEEYRYYWESDWKKGNSSWLTEENPFWEGNYKVKYWESDWQNIIYGNNNSYLKKILDAGFNGVYLDIIDAFEYFE